MKVEQVENDESVKFTEVYINITVRSCRLQCTNKSPTKNETKERLNYIH